MDGTPARRELAELKQAAQKLGEVNRTIGRQLEKNNKLLETQPKTSPAYKAAADQVEKLTKELQQNESAIASNKARQSELRDGIGLLGLSLNELRQKATELRKGLNAGVLNNEALQQNARELAQLELRIKAVGTANGRALLLWEQERAGIDLNRMSLEQLNLELQRWKIIRDTADPDTDVYREADAGIRATTDRLDQLTNTSRRTADEWARMRGSLKLDQLSIDQLKLEKDYLENLRTTMRRTDPELARIEDELLAVNRALETGTKETALYDRQWERARKNIKLSELSIEELEREIRFLKTSMEKIKGTDLAGLDSLRKQTVAAEAQLSRMRNGLGPLGQAWQAMKVNVMSAGAVLTAMFAGGAVVSGFRNLITGAGKVSDELANVQKATGLTAAEVRQLNSELGRIDTRTTTNDLREIAVGLGQAGQEISSSAIAAIDKINVALGDEFGEGSREIANTLSVLRNGFQDIKTANYGQDVLRIGNALNELGANGLATAPIISDITKRVAGAAGQYRIAAGDVLGLAATFQELGINVERGSTAYVRLLNKIAGEPDKFARVVRAAGLDVNLFNKQVNEDLQGAFITVAKAAKIAGASNTDFANILGELGTEGVGVSELLGKIGQNSDLLAQKSKLAGDSLQRTSSITAEFNTKNNNLQAQLDKLGKEFARVFSSRTVIDGITAIVQGLRSFLGVLKENSAVVVAVAKGLVTAVATLVAYRTGILAASVATRVAATAQAAWATVTGVLTGRIALATAAQAAFNTVTKLHPVGLLVGALTAAVGLFFSFGRSVATVSAEMKSLLGVGVQMNALFERIKDVNTSTNERRQLIEQLNTQYSKYLPYQVSEWANLQNIEEAQRGANRAILERINIEAKRAVLQERLAAASEAAAEVYQAQLAVEEARAFAVTGAGEITGKDDVSVGEKRVAAAERALKNRMDEAARLADDYQKAYRSLDGAALETPPPDVDGTSGTSGTPKAPDPDKVVDDIDEAAKKAEADYQKHLDNIEGILRKNREDLHQIRLSDDERALNQMDVAHAAEREQVIADQRVLLQARKLSEADAQLQLAQLDRQHANQRADLIEEQGQRRIDAGRAADEKYLQERIATEQRITDATWDAHLKQLEADVDYWDKRIAEAKERGEDYSALENERFLAVRKLVDASSFTEIQSELQKFDALILLAKQYGIDTTELEQERARAISAIQRQQRAQEKSETRKHGLEMRGLLVQRLRDFSSIAGGLNDLVGGIQQYQQAELSAAEAAADADDQRTSAEISRIEERKRAMREAALVAIAVQGAAAIANGVASAFQPGTPWPVAVAQALSTVGIVIGLMAQARALMSATERSTSAQQQQQTVPENVPLGERGLLLERGGAVNGAIRFQRGNGIAAPTDHGIFGGSSHREGGNSVYDNATGQQIAEVEEGEGWLVLSRAFTRNNKDQLSALLAASRTGERIAVVPKPIQVPTAETVGRALRVVHMADGGYQSHTRGTALVNTAAPTAFEQSTDAGTARSDGQDEVLALLRQLVTLQKGTLKGVEQFPSRIEAFTVLSKPHDRVQAKWDSLKARNTAKRA